MGVALDMQSEVVAAREAPTAERADEGSRARVLAVVSRQLVGARKLPVAPRPAATERLLSWKGTITRSHHYR